ncbi:MAG: hypothetical protein VYA86_05180 [Candidatus Thermoplasmatota archaeon]|nr:hypothetical protein [Candidatus Thermoplasmatota archaeon]
MRHLSVPRQETERILSQLKAESALPEGARVQIDPSDSNRTLIPVKDESATELLTRYPVIQAEPPTPVPRTYRDHLSSILSGDEIASIEWPTRHEFVGDLILIKLDAQQRAYGKAIGEAMLMQHTRTRAVFEDRGVIGQFRVRDLNLLAVRDGFDSTSRTRIIESGHHLWTDPSTVYYSARLSHERQGTLECAKKLRESLGRPISVCDPYAGVGPSLVPLVKEPDLLSDFFASDLNPQAVAFLQENISTELATLECVDALTLQERTELRGKFDLLLVNIPHDTLEHLPNLLPLLNEGGTVRGWAVIEGEDFENAKSTLSEMLGETVEIEVRRSYSATANLCRFESKISR